MKVQEFIEKYNEYGVELKTYLPVMAKKDLVMDVIAMCTYDMDGFIEVDRLRKKVCLEMFVLREYAGVEIASDFDELVAEYDMLRQSERYGDYEYAVNLEQYEIADMLEEELEEMLRENSLEAYVSQAAGQLKGLLNVIGEKLEDFDFSALLPEGTDMGQIIDLFNRS